MQLGYGPVQSLCTAHARHAHSVQYAPLGSIGQILRLISTRGCTKFPKRALCTPRAVIDSSEIAGMHRNRLNFRLAALWGL